MARTIQTIFNEIIASKDADADLSALNSTSATALHRLWAYITAVAHNIVEQFFDTHKAEVETLLELKEPGTPSWYAEKAKEWQFGDTLQVLPDNSLGYPIIDEAKQLVERVSYAEASDGTLFLKVAKDDGGSLGPLSTAEQNSLKSYFQQIKFAGTVTTIVSLNPDKLRFTGEVFFDGEKDPAVVQSDVEQALSDYCAALEFDGIVRKIKVIDFIQAVAFKSPFQIEGAHSV